MKKCLNCDDPVTGRADKKFCSTYCKSSYHYSKNLDANDSVFVIMDKQLKLNRRLLKSYNKAGKATVRKVKLIEEGFNPNFFTHFWKNNKGDVYLFCYEFGFLSKQENGRAKYVLVEWQSYMGKD